MRRAGPRVTADAFRHHFLAMPLSVCEQTRRDACKGSQDRVVMAEIIDARPSNGKAPSSDFALVTPTDFGFPFQPCA